MISQQPQESYLSHVAGTASLLSLSGTQTTCSVQFKNLNHPTRGNFVVVTSLQVQSLLLLEYIVQELCESRGGRPGLSVLMSLLVSVDVKIY